MIALLGQGKPLPADCPYKGEWLYENKLFLYRSDKPLDIELTPIYQSPDGELAIGFNACAMAEKLGTTVDGIFLYNQNRSLILEAAGPVPCIRGGAAAKAYYFTIDRFKRVEFRVEAGPDGSA